jgi:hypothetical protein
MLLCAVQFGCSEVKDRSVCSNTKLSVCDNLDCYSIEVPNLIEYKRITGNFDTTKYKYLFKSNHAKDTFEFTLNCKPNSIITFSSGKRNLNQHPLQEVILHRASIYFSHVRDTVVIDTLRFVAKDFYYSFVDSGVYAIGQENTRVYELAFHKVAIFDKEVLPILKSIHFWN